MTRKSIYLLVPQKGINSFAQGIDAERIKVVGGRPKAMQEAEAFERELNGGKTYHELSNECASPMEIAALSNTVWQVHVDTDRSWSDFKMYDKWPQRIQDEIETLLSQP